MQRNAEIQKRFSHGRRSHRWPSFPLVLSMIRMRQPVPLGQARLRPQLVPGQYLPSTFSD
jgi:hypothetical protein